MRNIQKPILTNLQLELLKLFAKNIPEHDLISIKYLIARYFSNKTTEKADKIWIEKDLNEDELLNTHLRTPYKSVK